MAQWFSGLMVQFHSGSLVQWLNGSTAKQLGNSVIQYVVQWLGWLSFSVAQCLSGSWLSNLVVQWLSDSVPLCHTGSIAQYLNDSIAQWSNPRVLLRKCGLESSAWCNISLEKLFNSLVITT